MVDANLLTDVKINGWKFKMPGCTQTYSNHILNNVRRISEVLKIRQLT